MKRERRNPTPESRGAEMSPVNVEVGFVNAVHSGEYTQEIVDALVGGDMIALEVVGWSPEKREEASEIANAIIRLPKEDSERESLIQDFDEMQSGGMSKPILMKLVEALSSSDKKIAFIDISSEHEAYEDPTIRFYKEPAFRLRMYKEDTETAKETMRGALVHAASVKIAREGVVTKQLKTIVKDLNASADDGATKKLRVFVGQAHTSPMHELRKDNIRTVREFVPAPGDNPLLPKQARAIFPFSIDAQRQLGFFPHKELSDELLGNVLLEYYLDRPLENAGVDGYEHLLISRRLIESLSEDEITEVFQHLDQIKKENEERPAAQEAVTEYLSKIVDKYLEQQEEIEE